MTTTWFDESYPPSIYPTPVVPPTGVTAGTPGAFAPPDATVPTSLAALRADPVIGDAGTNKPGAAWTTGQYVVLNNASHTHAYWDGTGWQSGNAPAPAPTIGTLTPNTGPEAGGTAITVAGTGFTGATGVGFDNLPGTAFGVVSATQINVVAPAHAPGAVDVVVAHPSGNATKAGGYTYTGAAEE